MRNFIEQKDHFNVEEIYWQEKVRLFVESLENQLDGLEANFLLRNIFIPRIAKADLYYDLVCSFYEHFQIKLNNKPIEIDNLKFLINYLKKCLNQFIVNNPLVKEIDVVKKAENFLKPLRCHKSLLKRRVQKFERQLLNYNNQDLFADNIVNCLYEIVDGCLKLGDVKKINFYLNNLKAIDSVDQKKLQSYKFRLGLIENINQLVSLREQLIEPTEKMSFKFILRKPKNLKDYDAELENWFLNLDKKTPSILAIYNSGFEGQTIAWQCYFSFPDKNPFKG